MAPPTYHLWLKPSGSAYDLFAQTIRELAQELNAPPFEPHITLLGRLDGIEPEHIERTRELADELQPFEVVFTGPRYGNEHFQCVFMRVRETPAIMNANILARHHFRHANETYMPHLSLVYGLYSEATKKAVISRLRPELASSFQANEIYLIKADTDDPKDWHEILTARLSG